MKNINKYSFLLFLIAFLLGDDNVLIRLDNGQQAQGEFIGTYMNHVHILTGDKIIYYPCDEIISIMSFKNGINDSKDIDYDCSKNTLTSDILFPPELDPMTGEWTQMLPDMFNPDIAKAVIKKKTTPIVQKSAEKVKASTVVSEEDFVIIDGVKYVKEAPEKETDPAQVSNNQATSNKAGPFLQFNVCKQANLDAVASTSFFWFGGGIMYYLGVPAYFLNKPEPSYYAISKIAPEDQLLYIECYKSAAQSERGKRMALGCGGLLLALMITEISN